MPQGKVRIDIFFEGKKKKSELVPITKGSLSVGRAPDVDIIVEDTFVSKKHCQIKLSAEAVMIEDMGSRNGTFVNGRKASSLELFTGDKIQLGKTTIVVNLPKMENSFEGATQEFHFQDTGEVFDETTRDGDATAREIHVDERPPKIKKTRKKKKFDIPETLPSLEYQDEIPYTDKKTVQDAALKDMGDSTIKSVRVDEPVYEDYEYFEDDDDDEDDEAGIDSYYDLVPKLIKSQKAKGYISSATSSKEERVEIISCRGDDVVDIKELTRGKKLKVIIGDKKSRFAAFNRPGQCQIYISENYSGHIYSEGRSIPISKAVAEGTRARGGKFRYGLKSGDVAEVDTGGRIYYVRFTQAPILPEKIKDPEDTKHYMNSLASSVALHVSFAVIFAIYAMFISASEANLRAQKELDKFVQIDLKDLEKKAEPTPEPTPEPRVVTTPSPTPTKIPKIKVKRRKVKVRSKQPKVVGVRKSRRAGGGGGSGNVNVAATGVLASLGGLSTDSRSSSNVVKAVSNLDAVKAPKGTRSNFSVSGLIEKSAHGDAKIVRISGPATKGKIGGVDKQFGAIGTLGGARGRGVGGVVVGDLPKFQEMGIKGRLSRAQILEVVNKHVGELNYCYEKGLFDDPGLEGKLNMFWEIQGSGRVGLVRIKRSSLRSTLVNQCVKGVIKKMKFPKPRGGGIVQVTFPFKFSAASF